MAVTILLDDDATAATGLTFSAAAGDTSAAQEFHVWFNKGTAGGSATSVRLQVEVEDPPGTWNAKDVQALDEHWFEARVNGGDNAAYAAGWVGSVSDWYRLGSGSFLPIPDINGNTARYVEVRLHPPLKGGVATEDVSFRLVVVTNENAVGISAGISDALTGILSGYGDRTVREFIVAPTLDDNGTPAAGCVVRPCRFIYDGIPYNTVNATGITLNQNDGAAEALTAGQAYKATISMPEGDGATEPVPVATKGLRALAANALPPDLPAGHLLIGVVTVVYQVGGTSIIPTSSMASLAVGSQFYPSGVGDADLVIEPGRALLKGTMLRETARQTFTPTPSSTTYFWLTTAGTVVMTATATPDTAGDVPICKVVKTSTITTITDYRTLVGLTEVPHRLYHDGNETIAANLAKVRLHDRSIITRVTAGLRTTGGTDNSTKLHVNHGGSSIFDAFLNFVSILHGNDAPTYAYPPIALRTVLDPGFLTLEITDITTGGSRAADIEVCVWTIPVAKVS